VPASTIFAAAFFRSDYVTGAHAVVDQPIPFSHAHHVGQLGIDCRYCHQTAEKAAYAGLPPTETCMNCHQQMWVGAETLKPVRESWRTGEPIRWNAVNLLPGYVYFDHSAHTNKGVGCVVCHGRVDQMPLTWQAQPLTMEWCVACHRDPGPRLRPESEVYSTLWKASGVPDPLTGATLQPRDEADRLVEKYHVRDARALTSCSVCHR
jgi:hypothetical protein